ncbi:sensor histidine kinase [Luteococcus peritonei]|uniref:histidine kinase n=1 Tax=Luteococcus peritonei TaxID=88874 RepID=A0ABW4S0C1_9ACTN
MERRSIFDELGHATWSLDLAVAGLFFVLTTVASAGYGATEDRLVRSVALGMVMALALVLRRRKPLTTLVVVTACCLVHVLVIRVPTPQIAAVALVAYSVARWVPGHRSRAVLFLGALGAVLGPARWLMPATVWESDGTPVRPPFPWPDAVLVGITMFGLVVSVYAIGRRVRESAEAGRARTLAQAERRALELAEREQATRAVEVSVRSQIARELHDVVAHSLSVMIVQAEGGRALAAKKPEQAAEVLDTIAETGREALTEMRRIVGVLRAPTEQAALYSPNPGLEEIPEMVSRSGERVRLEVSGTPPVVPHTLELTVYRVVQEAVTNFLKHAGAQATCTVRLSYTPALVVAEISDDGLGQASTSDGRGHGLRGMRERVAAMNGQLVAQPRSEGGYLVRAILPVPTRTTQEM